MKKKAKLKVLVTCGSTWVPIDDVRVISNVSTGQMGHLIAGGFRQKGAEVTVIEGPVTHALNGVKVKIIKYRFLHELSALLRQELLKKYDIIVHAAAVSDFKVSKTLKGKISSEKPLTLKLVPGPKLINGIKRLSPESLLVGFKLESKLDQRKVFETVRPLFNVGCDLVVANTLAGGYQGLMVNADGRILAAGESKEKIAKSLVGLLS